MFAKLATVIVVLGAMFGALLVNRQQRIDAASEISRLHFRMVRHERARTSLQAQVAAAVRPDRLRAKVEQVAGKPDVRHAFKPIPFRLAPERATDDALGSLDVDLAASGDELETETPQKLGG